MSDMHLDVHALSQRFSSCFVYELVTFQGKESTRVAGGYKWSLQIREAFSHAGPAERSTDRVETFWAGVV